MRKSIFVMVLSLVAVLAVACGGGNNSGNAKGNGGGGACGGGDGGGDAATEDAMAFYKKVGNFSLTKTPSKMKMGDEWKDQPASFTRMEVTKVDGDKITYKLTTYDADMKETYSADQTMDLTPKEAPEGDTTKAPEIKKEEIEVKAGKFNCMKVEASGSTSWSFKGMGVKTTMKSDMMDSTTELQEYKLD
jgi:hypothetical protein